MKLAAHGLLVITFYIALRIGYQTGRL